MAAIAIIDYGMGNLRSVTKALMRVAPNQRVYVGADPDRIHKAERVIFPGVGAIRDCIGELQRLELVDAVREATRDKPFLGICLGLHALLEHSDENDGIAALGMLPGSVRRFSGESGLKVPHMGWNRVRQARAHPIWRGIDDNSWFYFVHSYYVPLMADDSVGVSEYGVTFTAVAARGNMVATQFHPEKSQHAGLTLLDNFVRWDGAG